jgi:hypothetical protein
MVRGLRYAVLNAAIAPTLKVPHVSLFVLVALGLGTIALIFSDPRVRKTPFSGRLAIAAAGRLALTLGSLVVARLSLPEGSWGGGSYNYLLLPLLLLLAGVLLVQIARHRKAVLAVGACFLVVALVGANTFRGQSRGLVDWKSDGERLMRSAAASLIAGEPVYADQFPAPSTAYKVSPDGVRRLVAEGLLAPERGNAVTHDQALLNMQWRLVPASLAGECRQLAQGQSFQIPAAGRAVLTATGSETSIVVQYSTSAAGRSFALPGSPVALETVSTRPGEVLVQSGAAQVCLTSWH